MSGSDYVKQLTVFIENRRGRLAAICAALSETDINIFALSLADSADFGILRLIVSDPDKATAVLRQKGFTVVSNDLVAVEVEDRPGGLAKVLSALDEAGVNVEYLYPFAGRREGHARLAFRFEDPTEALRALRHAGIETGSPSRARTTQPGER